MRPLRMIAPARAAAGILHGSRAFGGPLQASIDLTNRCNLRCVHCYFFSPHAQIPNFESVRRARQGGSSPAGAASARAATRAELDAEELRELLGQLLALGTRRFQLSGGEPFLHRELLPSIARVKLAGAHCHINTNGTRLDRETADELVRLGLDELRITLMAGDPDGYLRTHPGAAETTFDSIRDHLSYLARRKRECRSPVPRVVLVSIVCAQNSDDVTGLARFAATVGADKVLYRPVDDVGDPGLASVLPSAEQAAAVRRQLPEAEALLRSRRISHNIPGFARVFGTGLDTARLYRVVPCTYGWLSTRVSAGGDVSPCCRSYAPLGNVHEQTFSEIWHGERYRAFRRDAVRLPRGAGESLTDCECGSCVHHTANLRAFGLLHPLRRWLVRKRLGVLPGDEG